MPLHSQNISYKVQILVKAIHIAINIWIVEKDRNMLDIRLQIEITICLQDLRKLSYDFDLYSLVLLSAFLD